MSVLVRLDNTYNIHKHIYTHILVYIFRYIFSDSHFMLCKLSVEMTNLNIKLNKSFNY